MVINIDTEKLNYILNMFYSQLDVLIEQVLKDSDTDPEYSAVAAVNTIKCYIQLFDDLGKPCPYNDVKSYFEYNGYTEQEYRLFEERRKKEARYYIGIQY